MLISVMIYLDLYDNRQATIIIKAKLKTPSYHIV